MGGAGLNVVGLLHPGEMGAALGAALRERGVEVLWASAGRSSETAERAQAAGFVDVGSVAELMRRAEAIVSVCPPHAASDLAGAVSGFQGVYLDANAIAPATARALAAQIEAGGGRFVDGGIVGPPPVVGRSARLYFSGPAAEAAAELFAGTPVEARVVSARVGDASALKAAFAGWTKGTAALLLALRAFARAEGVDAALLAEWRESEPELADRAERAARSVGRKGWRWVGEMDEIASALDAVGLPPGFHRAAAELFERVPREQEATLDVVLGSLATRA